MSTITFDFRHHYQRGERRESEQIAYQWDLGHVMEVFVPEDATYTIGYCFGDYEKTEDYAIDTKVQNPDGSYKLTAHIPNKYFERSRELRVYVVGSADDHIITTYEGFITIRGRIQPDDYVDDDPENGATQIIEEARKYATKSQSYSVGGTGTREGEDTDNAKYYLEEAQRVAGSIPEDYSELSDDVDQLKNALIISEVYAKHDVSNPDNYYVTQKGSYVATASDLRSITVDLLPGQTIHMYGYGYRALVSIFAKRTGEVGAYTYTPLVISIDNTQRDYTYTANESMTIAVSFRTKVAGAVVKNECFSVFNVSEKYAELKNGKLDGSLFNEIWGISNNLYDYREAKDNTSISTSTGEESTNADRWSTGFIPFDRSVSTYLLCNKWNLYTFICYKSDKTYNTSIFTAEYPIPIPADTAYIRAVFNKTNYPFSIADQMFFGYAYNYPAINNTAEIFKDGINLKPVGYFDLRDLGNTTFTESFKVRIKRGYESWKNMIVRVRAMYTGSTAPDVTFRYIKSSITESYNDSVFTSVQYELGGNGFYNSQSFRVPPFPHGLFEMYMYVNVPEGTILTIQDIHSESSNAISTVNDGIRFNAHQGFIQLCPQDSIVGYEMAARLGFNRCVAIPKATADGKFVCFHDDDKVGTKIVDANGDVLSTTLQNTPISGFTSSELSEYYLNPGSSTLMKQMYPKEKIPTLEEFFDVCSKTGMHPMLSTHPALTQTEWQEIMELAKRYNVLKTLNIKFALDTGEQATASYSVFGDEVESYVVDVNTVDGNGIYYMDTFFSNATNRLCIELMDNSGVVTDEKIQQIVGAGYECSIANVNRWNTEQLKHWMNIGVTEFTIDYFASVGLNW